MSDSLQPQGGSPVPLGFSRLPCWWYFPCKNTGLGCYFLLQRIFQIQGSILHLLCLLHWQADFLPLMPPGKPVKSIAMPIEEPTGFCIQHCFVHRCKTLSAICNKRGRDFFLIWEQFERVKYLESHSFLVKGIFLYWVGQEVHSGFPITSCGKTWANLLANLIILL